MNNQKSGKKSLADQKVMVCLTQDEYDQLAGLMTVSRFETMSGLLRHLIEEKKVVARYSYSTHEPEMRGIEAISEGLDRCCADMRDITIAVFRAEQKSASVLALAIPAAFIYQTAGQTVELLSELIYRVAGKRLAGQN